MNSKTSISLMCFDRALCNNVLLNITKDILLLFWNNGSHCHHPSSSRRPGTLSGVTVTTLPFTQWMWLSPPLGVSLIEILMNHCWMPVSVVNVLHRHMLHKRSIGTTRPVKPYNETSSYNVCIVHGTRLFVLTCNTITVLVYHLQ